MSSLGFDTSNYTTSVAVIDNGSYIQSRKILSVKQGERGLRQSDALFQHVKQLPEIIKEIDDFGNITAVGVSDKPRNVEGSYMPVFLAGISFAETAAAVLNVPLFKFSHQDGHIMSGILSCGGYELMNEPFLSIHMSGGTTEILITKYNGYNFDTKIVGGTLDISAGQVIDRVGVHFGMPFPAGKYLDELCFKSEKPIKFPVSCKDGFFNFSGLETKACKEMRSNGADVASGVFTAIAETLAKSVNYCISETGCERVLFVGGVASSKFIKPLLNMQIKAELYFSTPELSSDNACGIAALADMCLNRGELLLQK